MRLIILFSSFLLIAPVFSEPITEKQGLSLQEEGQKFQPLELLSRNYYFASDLNPYYLRGDFNGDGKMDVVAYIQDIDQRRFGLAFFHKGEEDPIIVGAGNEFGNGGMDFVWLDVWRVSQIKKIPGKNKKDEPIKLKGEALLIQKHGSGGAYVYWDGEAYKWHQYGD